MKIMFEASKLSSEHIDFVPDWVVALDAGLGFVADNRYNRSAGLSLPVAENSIDVPESKNAKTYEDGHAQGLADAAELAGSQTAERRKLGSNLRRMDEQIVEQLSCQLSETIVALCEVTLAPLALDRDLLVERCRKAARILGESHGDLILRLSPDDIEALDETFLAAWNISPDPDLSQGSLRIEGPNGGICDGPSQWRTALIETLGLERN